MAFIDEMEGLATALREQGYEVDTPVREEQKIDWATLSEDEGCELKRSYIDGHLSTIKHSDLVLIANYPKNGIVGYIGANSLMEAAFAYALGVPVAFLHPVGEQPCQLEALSIARTIVGDDTGSVSAVLPRDSGRHTVDP